MKKAILTLAILFTTTAAFADKKNCKVMVQLHSDQGKTEVMMVEVEADSYAECKELARDQKRDLLSENPQARAKATFGYSRKPAITN